MLRTDEWTDERTDGRTDKRSGPTTRPAFANATQVKLVPVVVQNFPRAELSKDKAGVQLQIPMEFPKYQSFNSR